MMALVVLEAVIVALLAFLVIGLLRSHAEILRQLHQLGAGAAAGGAREEEDQAFTLTPRSGGRPLGHDLIGETPAGEAVAIGVKGAAHNTLVAFLSSGCATCSEFWRAFAAPARLGLPAGTRLVVATRGPEAESVTAIRQAAPAELTVVMTTTGWQRYAVPGSPYFVLVDGPAGTVLGEGTGTTWAQVQSLMDQALGDRAARLR